MISVVMPYWRRPDALRTNIAAYRSFYGDEIEIVVVDDGSGDVPPVDATIVTLPAKNKALNPSVPFNRGVDAAKGNILVITNPEVIHITAILSAMKESLTENGYVAAACWSPTKKWWYCHSSKGPPPQAVGRAPIPPGAGLHFCAMLHRSLYERIGGFSEEYRQGQGYEDNDFLWKLHAAGADFVIRDDLVTEHVECPRCQWPQGGIGRNRRIFEEKWPV